MLKMFFIPLYLVKVSVLSLIIFLLNIFFTVYYVIKYILTGEQVVARLFYGIIIVVCIGLILFCRPLFLLMFSVFMTYELYHSIRKALTL